jgi:lysozyme
MASWLCGLAALLGATVWLIQYGGTWHPSDADFPHQGIDVSHHQGRIDWQKLPAQGVDLAYIKATEGGDHRDSRFIENWTAAHQAGIRRGAYHFFTFCRSGADQAANFIASVPVDADALPPAVDLEYLGNCSNQMSREAFQAELATFIERVEARYQKPVLLYLTAEFDKDFGISSRFDRPLWLRNLIFEPRFGDHPWQVWQMSNFRRLEGIDGRVDWNVWR